MLLKDLIGNSVEDGLDGEQGWGGEPSEEEVGTIRAWMIAQVRWRGTHGQCDGKRIDSPSRGGERGGGVRLTLS